MLISVVGDVFRLAAAFAMARGGSFTTAKPSEHTRTAMALIERFTDRRSAFSQTGEGAHLVEVR